MFENIREDFNTYDRNPFLQGFWVMCAYRFGRMRYQIKSKIIRMPFSAIYKFWHLMNQILTGIELPCEVKLGRRVRIDHFSDIIISGDAEIGDDVIIRNGVTIGLKNTGKRGSPKIGNRVDIGAGAKILGAITIGDDAVIGANAVVLVDIPPNHMAVGVPARILPRKNPICNP